MLQIIGWGIVGIAGLFIIREFLIGKKEINSIKNVENELLRFSKILEEIKNEIEEPKRIDMIYKLYLDKVEENSFIILKENIDNYTKMIRMKEGFFPKSENYFNEENILENKFNIQSMLNRSSIMTGIGILGTFVGIAIGLSGLGGNMMENNEVMDEIMGNLDKNSIDHMLSGMHVSFLTSILGIFFSLIHSHDATNYLGRSKELIHKITNDLNSFFPSNLELDIHLQNIEYYLKTLNNEFSQNLGGEISSSISNSANNLFGTFGKTIESSMANLSKDLRREISSVFNQLFNSEFLEQFQTIQDGLAETAKFLKVNTNSLLKIQKTFPQFTEELEAMMEASTQIYSNVIKSVQEYDKYMKGTENFLEGFSKMQDLQIAFREDVHSMIEGSNLTFKSYKEMGNTTIDLIHNLSNYNQLTLETSKELVNQNYLQIENIRNEVDNKIEELSKKIGEYNSIMSKGIQELNTSISSSYENSSKMIDKSVETLERYDETFSQVNEKLLEIVENVNDMTRRTN